MNKEQLVKAIAEDCKIPQKQVTQVLNSFIDQVMDAIANEDDVTLIGFGSFKHAVQSERKARNPSTGEEITVPAKNTVRFSPGKSFKEAIN